VEIGIGNFQLKFVGTFYFGLKMDKNKMTSCMKTQGCTNLKKNHLKILDAIKSDIKFHTEYPQTLGDTVQN